MSKQYQTVQEKLSNGAYTTKLPYPEKVTKPSLPSGANSAQAREYADKLAEYEIAVIDNKAAKLAYHTDIGRLEQTVLREDLEAEYGLKDHPKAQKIWDKAWEHGHSAGLSDVIYWYDELAELVL